MKTMLTRMSLVAAVVAATTAGPALADKGGVPHNGGGSGNDHAAQPATPAQPGAPGDGATPAKPAQPTKKHAATKTKRSTSAPQSSHAKAGKTTICHATGSATNPYVQITISNNAVAAHRRHQDGRDIIPANGDCPAGTARTQAKSKSESGSSHAKAGKTTICHATGSATNPFVTITISDNALDAHRRHQDGRDVIPASGDCPATALSQPTPPTGETQAGETQTAAASSGTLGTSFAKARSRVLGARASGGTNAADVAAEDADDATATLPAEATAAADGDSSGLPFTGLDLGILAAVGAALMLAGTALRRARRTTRVSS
jgi:hypothetical protein